MVALSTSTVSRLPEHQAWLGTPQTTTARAQVHSLGPQPAVRLNLGHTESLWGSGLGWPWLAAQHPARYSFSPQQAEGGLAYNGVNRTKRVHRSTARRSQLQKSFLNGSFHSQLHPYFFSLQVIPSSFREKEQYKEMGVMFRSLCCSLLFPHRGFPWAAVLQEYLLNNRVPSPPLTLGFPLLPLLLVPSCLGIVFSFLKEVSPGVPLPQLWAQLCPAVGGQELAVSSTGHPQPPLKEVPLPVTGHQDPVKFFNQDKNFVLPVKCFSATQKALITHPSLSSHKAELIRANREPKSSYKVLQLPLLPQTTVS